MFPRTLPAASRGRRSRALAHAALAAAVLTLGALAGPTSLTGCSSLPAVAGDGPTVGLRNETDTLLKVQFWTGERDDTRRGGARMSRAESLEVRPRTRAQGSLAHLLEYRSAGRTVVRAQIRPAGTSFAGPSEFWYELSPPSPFVIRATRTPGGEFVFTRDGQGTLTPVPPELWAD
ncbi:MAG TPA: hypothetical protein VD963_06855 [Phycisphaerales bacterium]|nr:hypothetical protein [Phycisphaerales bacterium]